MNDYLNLLNQIVYLREEHEKQIRSCQERLKGLEDRVFELEAREKGRHE